MKFKSLREVPLKNYQELKKKKKATDIDVLTILFGYEWKNIKKAKQKDIDKVIANVESELEKNNELVNILEMGGVEYGFIPNLDEITYGENADICQYISDWQKMHLAMSVLYRPITAKVGDRYLIEDYEGTGERAEIMKGAPLDVVLAAVVFFYNLTRELLKCIPSYLKEELKTELLKEEVFKESGEDIQKFIHLLKETSEDLTRSRDYRSLNV